MKEPRLIASLLVALAFFTGHTAWTQQATPAPTERWQTTGFGGGPWTFEFTVSGTTLSGTVRQTGAPSNPINIVAGKIEGTTLSFRILTSDGERVITFHGRINGNEMSVVREITVLPGGTRGGNDLYGGSAPLQFIAKRAGSAVSNDSK